MNIDQNRAFEVIVESIQRIRNTKVDHAVIYPPESTQYATFGYDTLQKYEVGEDLERLYEVVAIYWTNHFKNNVSADHNVILTNSKSNMIELIENEGVVIVSLTYMAGA